MNHWKTAAALLFGPLLGIGCSDDAEVLPSTVYHAEAERTEFYSDILRERPHLPTFCEGVSLGTLDEAAVLRVPALRTRRGATLETSRHQPDRQNLECELTQDYGFIISVGIWVPNPRGEGFIVEQWGEGETIREEESRRTLRWTNDDVQIRATAVFDADPNVHRTRLTFERYITAQQLLLELGIGPDADEDDRLLGRTRDELQMRYGRRLSTATIGFPTLLRSVPEISRRGTSLGFDLDEDGRVAQIRFSLPFNEAAPKRELDQLLTRTFGPHEPFEGRDRDWHFAGPPTVIVTDMRDHLAVLVQQPGAEIRPE